MKVIKKINNNVAVCLDNNDHELIAFGKGIGFPKIPYVLENLAGIDRTFYGINDSYFELIQEIPEEIIELTARIVDIARNYLNCNLNDNITFTLADHINFAIDRQKKKMVFNYPMAHDLQYFYQQEMEMGEIAVNMIAKELHISLPKEEAASIAVHLMNAKVADEQMVHYENHQAAVDDITKIVERELQITIEKKDFNYSRFATHLLYLLKRKDNGDEISSENKKLYRDMTKEFPKIYACVLKISDYITTTLHWRPSEEELIYLMLHLNRLYARMDCNQ